MIVKRHSHYQPDTLESSLPSNSPSANNQPPAPQVPALSAGEAVAPVVRGINPVTVKEYAFGKPASDQQGLFIQHEALNGKINGLIDQQPTYEAFVKEKQQYVANTPGAVDQIGTLFADSVSRFWTSPRPGTLHPEPPQNQLINLHREMLSTQAALRVADGTLSTQSKGLIDKAFRYPTLSERERAFPNGSRVGVYPITVDDNTPNGARLAGAFMITATDGSQATEPHWPNGDKSIAANEANGPVVLYTPGEGFEEFANPAQLRAALMQRIDAGGVPEQLLSQSLPLPAQTLRSPLRADDLTLGFSPTSGDVIAQGIPQLLARQKAELEALVRSDTSDLSGPQISQAMNDAANWSSQFDANNAMLSRSEKLEDKLQPQWLKDLPPIYEGEYQYLKTREQQSSQSLVPLLEKIPSLQSFAKQQLNAALQEKYRSAVFDADKIQVTITRESRVHTGFRPGGYTPRNTTRTSSSLTDLALKNPTAWPAAESHQFSTTSMKAVLTNASGGPVLGPDGKPVVLQTDELKTLVNELDVGGNYIKLLKRRMAPDAVAGEPAKLRAAWKDNLSDVMKTQALIGELNPQAYPENSSAVGWVKTLLDFPDAATRPEVDGKKIVANTLNHHGQPLQGVVAIGNGDAGPLVLYSPDAPDGMSWRQVENQEALEALFTQPQWSAYAKRKAAPLNPDPLGRALKGSQIGNVISTVSGVGRAKELASSAFLTPIKGNFLDTMYKQLTDILIDHADLGSVSSAEAAQESTQNKIVFGFEVATAFLDLLPVVGKGISTAIRVGKTGLRVLKSPGKSIVRVLDKPNRLALIYSRYGKAGAAADSTASPILRPVLTLSASPSGVFAAHPLPDLSVHSLPDSLLTGRTLRGDGTYQVGNQFYVRYTDGTGVSKPYEISSIYKIEGGQVRVIDPSTRKTVAFLQSAGGGEWRQSRLLGGEKKRKAQLAPPEVTNASPTPVQPSVSNGAKRPRLLESFPGERSTMAPPVKGQNVFYHYTNKKGHASILKDWTLNSSGKDLIGDSLPYKKGRHYFTDLAPEDAPTRRISETIFGNRRYGNALDKMTHYYEVNTTGLNIMRHPDNPHIFYVDTPFDIPMQYPVDSTMVKRVMRHGATPYTPV